MRRPIELIQMSQSFGHDVDADDVEELGGFFATYGKEHTAPDASPWQEDQLETERARACRADYMRREGYGDVLDEPEEEHESCFLLEFDVTDAHKPALAAPVDRDLLVKKYLALRHFTRALRDWEGQWG